MPKTPEELEQEQKELEGKVEEAAEEAKEAAKNKGLSQEDVNKAVEAARKEEKDKLYPQLEEVKNQLKSVQEILRTEREEKDKQRKEAEEKAEKQRQAKLSDADKTLEAIAKLEEQLKDERNAREESDRRNEEYQREERLRRYREKVIKAAEGKLLPELVTGRTEEEIDESIVNAKARYEEIYDAAKTELGVQTRDGMPRSTNPDTEALDEEELERQVSAVDTDKYLQDPEYRDKIKAQVAAAYMKAAGR